MRKNEKTLLAGVAALALIAGTGLAAAQQSNGMSNSSSPGSPGMSQRSNTSQSEQHAQSGTRAGESKPGESKSERGMTAKGPQGPGRSTADTQGPGKSTAEKGGKADKDFSRSAKKGDKADRDLNRSVQKGGNTDKELNRSAEQNGGKNLNGSAQKGDKADRDLNRSARKGGNNEKDLNRSAEQNNGKNLNPNPEKGGKAGVNAAQQRDNNIPKGLQGNANLPMQGSEAKGTNEHRAQGVNLSADQQTRVRETVLSRNDAPRIDHVDFSLNVGTVVPTRVHLVEVPSTLVEIYPEWRGDDYFIAEDDIVIVDRSHKIIATIPTASNRASVSTESRSFADLSPAEIREVQTVLIERGYLKGRADGHFGPETRNALVAFQKSEGMEASGRIDSRTISSLGLSGKLSKGHEQGATNDSQNGQGANQRQSSTGSERNQQGGNAQTPDNGPNRGAGVDKPNEQSAAKQGTKPDGRNSATPGGSSQSSSGSEKRTQSGTGKGNERSAQSSKPPQEGGNRSNK